MRGPTLVRTDDVDRLDPVSVDVVCCVGSEQYRSKPGGNMCQIETILILPVIPAVLWWFPSNGSGVRISRGPDF